VFTTSQYAFYYVGDGNTEIPCRLNINGTVVCERYVYSNVHEWTRQKAAVESIINNYRRRVSILEVNLQHCQLSYLETELVTM